MRRQLVNEKREERTEAEVHGNVEIDSVDSPIRACGISMLMRSHVLMRFAHAHEVLLCQGQGITKAY